MVLARSIHASCALALVLATSITHGQECVKGERDTTAAERQTVTSILENALAALPAAPEGWIVGGYEGISVLQRLCMDYEDRPWAYGISRTYNRADDVESRQQVQEDAGAALRASMEARQPRMDAVMAKMQELGTALGAAAQARDQARIDEINRQLAAAQVEMEAVMAEGPSAEQLVAIGNLVYQDREMSIAVQVNAAVAQTADLETAPPPAGALAAFRGEQAREGVTTAESIVLLGNWQPRTGGGMQLTRRGNLSSAATHGVIVTVRADPVRIDSLFASIDFGRIAALVR
jgi:hypothetical protein